MDIHVHLVLRVHNFVFLLHFRKSRLTVNNTCILDAILESKEEQEEEIDVFLEALEGDQSNGYSGSDDEGNKDPSHLSARVLLAPAKLRRKRER